jgi:hypothetical protein
MKQGHGEVQDNYGISRIDDTKNRTHAWRVSLRRHGRRHVKNFPDRKWGGAQDAFTEAKQYRDQLISAHSPITRKEVCAIKRSNNKSGISGVCTYAKRYPRSDGSLKENWYWEASWPGERGRSCKAIFSVATYGQEMARQMAIRARKNGLEGIEGVIWCSEPGLLEPSVTSAQSEANSYNPQDSVAV